MTTQINCQRHSWLLEDGQDGTQPCPECAFDAASPLRAPEGPEHGQHYGMDLRDYFAAKALQGICASGPGISFSNTRLAKEAYDLADAMLEQRAKAGAA